ncbi:MAG: VWA domain-containing protein [Bryobacteraceae bacterium]|nr:VWA domain-containing protein [Bryobacteraceae bacterium]
MRSPYSVVLFGLMIPAVLCGQSQSPASLPQLVRTRVVVTDAKGAPVLDLKSSDFRVTDQNRQLAPAFLHPPFAAHPAPQPAAGWVHSRGSDQTPHTVAILFDLFNLMQNNRLDSFQRVEAALPRLASSGNVYFYLLNLDGTLEGLVPAQDDKGNILTPPADWHRNASRLLQKFSKNLGRARPAGILQEDVVKKTYVALETVGKHLGAFPGVRDLIWITDGVPTVFDTRQQCSGDWVECALYVPHLVVTLDNAGVAVHPLSYGILQPDVTLAMEDIAGLTGGRTFYREDLDSVATQLVQSASASYLLLMAPPPDNWDNRFHRLRVQCERKGVRIVSRQRYYAYPSQSQVPALEFAAMTALLKIPADAPEVELRGQIAPGSKPGTAMVRIRIDPMDLFTIDDAGNAVGQVSVMYAQYDGKNLLGSTQPMTFNLRMPRQQFMDSAKEGLPFDQEIVVDPRAKSVRFILYDRGSRFLGSVTLPVPPAK